MKSYLPFHLCSTVLSVHFAAGQDSGYGQLRQLCLHLAGSTLQAPGHQPRSFHDIYLHLKLAMLN